MRRDHVIRRVLRSIRRAVPWRRQVRQQLRSWLGIQRRKPQDLRPIAELAGIFDAEWYLSAYKDVASSGIDPFVHYMSDGWREGRKPASGVDIERIASMLPGFEPGRHNPMSFLLRSPSQLRAAQSKISERKQLNLPRALEDGLCVSGYLRSEIGLGQAARNIVYACDAVRLPVSSRSIALPSRENDEEFATKCNPIVDRKAHLVVTGLGAAEHYRLDVAPGRRNILFPFWELGSIPQEWHAAIRDFDEVWAPSRFVASAFDGISGVTLHYVPQPVKVPSLAPSPRPDRSTLRCFTYLDFDSYVARKNPQAAVNAFRAAFPLSKRDVELVVKTRGKRDEGLRQWLGETAARDGRIAIVDDTLDRRAVDALMTGCDVFLSLHRSEGFGFGAAEALAAGKAVVATDYGGTTDFINEQTGYPIACTLEPVRDGEYLQTEGQVWAEPNADAAVEALRAIHGSPGEAQIRGRRGFDLLVEQQSLPVVGRRIARILEDLGLVRSRRS